MTTSFGLDYIVVARWLADWLDMERRVSGLCLLSHARSLARSDERCKGEQGSSRGEGREESEREESERERESDMLEGLSDRPLLIPILLQFCCIPERS